MRNLVLGFIFLVVLVGCADTGSVGSDQAIHAQSRNSPSVEDTDVAKMLRDAEAGNDRIHLAIVEVLILVVIFIFLRGAYLWLFRGKEEAKEFVDKSANEVNKGMGCVLIGAIVLMVLFFLLIAALS